MMDRTEESTLSHGQGWGMLVISCAIGIMSKRVVWRSASQKAQEAFQITSIAERVEAQ